MEQATIQRNPPSGFIERELPYPIAAAWTKVRAFPRTTPRTARTC
jgi:hypothetical protein